MSKVISIPRALSKEGELVIIPRNEYERLLNVSKDRIRLDQGITRALKEIQKGKIMGPFENPKALMKSLLT